MARALEVFSQFVARHGLSRTSPVAVAVSGGSDSMALTVLAKQFFQSVVGITVDHNLCEESTEEARRTKELVLGLGVKDHHTLTIDWEGNPPTTPTKVQVRARERRYPMMLELCARKRIPLLLVSHHRDDQIEMFLARLSRRSSVDGLGGMFPIVNWPEYPGVSVVRPLLNCDKGSLVEVCRGEGVEWVEDASNKSPLNMRDVIRSLVAEHPEIIPGLTEVVETCADARVHLQSEVNIDIIRDLMTVDNQFGVVTVNATKFRKLSPAAARKVVHYLFLFVNGGNMSKTILFHQYAELCDVFRNPSTHSNISANGTLIVPLNANCAMITKDVTRYLRVLTPIKVGETIHWDNRFKVSLAPLRVGINDYKATIQRNTKEFFVRHMIKPDWAIARKGIRKVRANKLPHKAVRCTLPVIVDGSENIILVPHFRVIDRTAGVISTATFEPGMSLQSLFVGSLKYKCHTS